jgi:hypothetical protein
MLSRDVAYENISAPIRIEDEGNIEIAVPLPPWK